jgi:transcriptional regulator with XRE-family HTH domain
MKPKTFAELYKDVEAHEDYWIAGSVQEFTEEIFRLMEQEGVSRSELARRLGSSPAYVTKIFRGNANFTLATMVRLARALGAELRFQLAPVATVDRDVSKRTTARPQKRQGRVRRPSDPVEISRPASPGLTPWESWDAVAQPGRPRRAGPTSDRPSRNPG